MGNSQPPKTIPSPPVLSPTPLSSTLPSSSSDQNPFYSPVDRTLGCSPGVPRMTSPSRSLDRWNTLHPRSKVICHRSSASTSELSLTILITDGDDSWSVSTSFAELQSLHNSLPASGILFPHPNDFLGIKTYIREVFESPSYIYRSEIVSEFFKPSPFFRLLIPCEFPFYLKDDVVISLTLCSSFTQRGNSNRHLDDIIASHLRTSEFFLSSRKPIAISEQIYLSPDFILSPVEFSYIDPHTDLPNQILFLAFSWHQLDSGRPLSSDFFTTILKQFPFHHLLLLLSTNQRIVFLGWGFAGLVASFLMSALLTHFPEEFLRYKKQISSNLYSFSLNAPTFAIGSLKRNFFALNFSIVQRSDDTCLFSHRILSHSMEFEKQRHGSYLVYDPHKPFPLDLPDISWVFDPDSGASRNISDEISHFRSADSSASKYPSPPNSEFSLPKVPLFGFPELLSESIYPMNAIKDHLKAQLIQLSPQSFHLVIKMTPGCSLITSLTLYLSRSYSLSFPWIDPAGIVTSVSLSLDSLEISLDFPSEVDEVLKSHTIKFGFSTAYDASHQIFSVSPTHLTRRTTPMLLFIKGLDLPNLFKYSLLLATALPSDITLFQQIKFLHSISWRSPIGIPITLGCLPISTSDLTSRNNFYVQHIEPFLDKLAEEMNSKIIVSFGLDKISIPASIAAFFSCATLQALALVVAPFAAAIVAVKIDSSLVPDTVKVLLKFPYLLFKVGSKVHTKSISSYEDALQLLVMYFLAWHPPFIEIFSNFPRQNFSFLEEILFQMYSKQKKITGEEFNSLIRLFDSPSLPTESETLPLQLMDQLLSNMSFTAQYWNASPSPSESPEVQKIQNELNAFRTQFKSVSPPESLNLHLLFSLKSSLLRRILEDFSGLGVLGMKNTGKSQFVSQFGLPHINSGISEDSRTTTVNIYPSPAYETAFIMDFPGSDEADRNGQDSRSEIRHLSEVYLPLMGAAIIILPYDNIGTEAAKLIKMVSQLNIPFLICLNKADRYIFEMKKGAIRRSQVYFDYIRSDQRAKLTTLARITGLSLSDENCWWTSFDPQLQLDHSEIDAFQIRSTFDVHCWVARIPVKTHSSTMLRSECCGIFSERFLISFLKQHLKSKSSSSPLPDSSSQAISDTLQPIILKIRIVANAQTTNRIINLPFPSLQSLRQSLSLDSSIINRIFYNDSEGDEIDICSDTEFQIFLRDPSRLSIFITSSSKPPSLSNSQLRHSLKLLTEFYLESSDPSENLSIIMMLVDLLEGAREYVIDYFKNAFSTENLTPLFDKLIPRIFAASIQFGLKEVALSCLRYTILSSKVDDESEVNLFHNHDWSLKRSLEISSEIAASTDREILFVRQRLSEVHLVIPEPNPPIAVDGNSFYSSVAYLHFNNANRYPEIRSQVVSWLANNFARIFPFIDIPIDTYLETMARDSEAADQNCLFAVADIFQKQIIIFSSSERAQAPIRIKPLSSSDIDPPFHVLHWAKSHYEPLEPDLFLETEKTSASASLPSNSSQLNLSVERCEASLHTEPCLSPNLCPGCNSNLFNGQLSCLLCHFDFELPFNSYLSMKTQRISYSIRDQEFPTILNSCAPEHEIYVSDYLRFLDLIVLPKLFFPSFSMENDSQYISLAYLLYDDWTRWTELKSSALLWLSEHPNHQYMPGRALDDIFSSPEENHNRELYLDKFTLLTLYAISFITEMPISIVLPTSPEHKFLLSFEGPEQQAQISPLYLVATSSYRYLPLVPPVLAANLPVSYSTFLKSNTWTVTTHPHPLIKTDRTAICDTFRLPGGCRAKAPHISPGCGYRCLIGCDYDQCIECTKYYRTHQTEELTLKSYHTEFLHSPPQLHGLFLSKQTPITLRTDILLIWIRTLPLYSADSLELHHLLFQILTDSTVTEKKVLSSYPSVISFLHQVLASAKFNHIVQKFSITSVLEWIEYQQLKCTIHPSDPLYLISASWYSQWKGWLINTVKQPGPIDNSTLFLVAPKHLKAAEYRAIPERLWNLLHSKYQGGPELQCITALSPRTFPPCTCGFHHNCWDYFDPRSSHFATSITATACGCLDLQLPCLWLECQSSFTLCQDYTTCRTCQARDISGIPQDCILKKENIIERSIMLGRGAFGLVNRGFYLDTPVAIKSVSFPRLDYLRNEAKFWQSFDHPNLVKLLGVLPGFPFKFIMELMHCSLEDELCELFRNSQSLSWPIRWGYLRDITSGLLYLHRIRHIHRDLKPSNILLSLNNFVEGDCNRRRCKISDFGSLRSANERGQAPTMYLQGTPTWLAPELMLAHLQASNDVFSTQASDIYSLGMTFYFILSHQPPWPSQATMIQSFQSLNATPNIPNPSVAPPVEMAPEWFISLIKKCAAFAPAARPSIADVHLELITMSSESASSSHPENVSSHLVSEQ